MFKQISEFLEDTTDKLIALIVITAAIICIIYQIGVPEWFSMLIGMIGMYFFKKDKYGDK